MKFKFTYCTLSLLILCYFTSCSDDFLKEENVEQLPETVDEDFPEKMDKYDKPESPIIAFDSIPQINQSLLRKSSIIRDEPGGQVTAKVHSDSFWVNCSIDHKGNWIYISFEADEEFEYKKVHKGKIHHELWKDGKRLASFYLVKDKKGKYWPSTSSDGYTHLSNIISSTMPEKELDKIIKSENLSRSAFDEYLWKFNFQHGGEIEGYEHSETYYLHPNAIDGWYTIDRLVLFFQNDKLIAYKHKLPMNNNGEPSFKCENGLVLKVIADWSESEIQGLVSKLANCDQ